MLTKQRVSFFVIIAFVCGYVFDSILRSTVVVKIEKREVRTPLELAIGRKVNYIHTFPTNDSVLDMVAETVEVKQKLDNHRETVDDKIAKNLFKKVRVLCWIMTSNSNLHTRAVHVNRTWGRRCNKLLFMSDIEDPSFPAIGLGTPKGREHLTAKTMRAFDYVYKHYFDSIDWFLKADDDTYVIVENLRYMLSNKNPQASVFYGHHIKDKNTNLQGFTSGGAGYILSSGALKKFAKRKEGLCADDLGDEDVELSHCMEKVGVTLGDSRDRFFRSRFHCYLPEIHIHGEYPQWYHTNDKFGAQQGIRMMSDYPISFHYVTPKTMYNLEFYSYHLNIHGIMASQQDLNGDTNYLPDKLNNTKTILSTISPSP